MRRAHKSEGQAGQVIIIHRPDPVIDLFYHRPGQTPILWLFLRWGSPDVPGSVIHGARIQEAGREQALQDRAKSARPDAP